MNLSEPSHEQGAEFSMIAATLQFLRAYWFRFLLISTGLLVPCFWHRHIEAGDLASHVYNAWIAQLIKAGQLPGLWLDHRRNNVFFDYALSGLRNFLGWGSAEKIATSGAVLIFFWGAFALISAFTRTLPWFVLPCLAIFTYGWTFEMGFMNCYISFGLAFFALAILVRARGWQRGLALILVPPIWLAHPLGAVILVTVGSYALLAERISPRQRLVLLIATVSVLAGIHLVIRIHFPSNGVIWGSIPNYVHDGFNQLLLYGPKYLLTARLLRVFLCICLLLDFARRRHSPRWWAPYQLPAELYLIILTAIALLPTDIDSRRLHQMGFVSIGYLNERMTSVLAILACCLLGTIKTQKWHLPGFSAIAVVFFFFLYNDTAAISRMEDQLDGLVQNLPSGQRVIGTIETFPATNVGSAHIIDRACVDHCFSYDNYEPKVAQFRVRASVGNAFVMVNRPTISDGSIANYVVQQHDLPLSEIDQCEFGGTALCVRALAAGDKTAVGFTLDRGWVARFNRTSLIIDLLLASILASSVLVGQHLFRGLWSERSGNSVAV
jgi:hypothetical protein